MDIGSSETRLSSTLPRHAEPAGYSPGTILADRYRIVALAGRGGMGEVYRAEDLRLGQTVALKFLPSALEQDSGARDRLLAEVRAARSVSHPNVCRVYDIGDVAGRVFFTMEYVDGEDLASLLRRIGKLPPAKALDVARELCAGLAAAHDKKLLHRDLKPANVMIDGRGHARIMDFGLAVDAAATGSPADLAGTPAYLAPERFEGKPATVQSDLYGLGLILFETCTGTLPFSAGTAREWREAHVLATPPSPRSLAADLEPSVERVILRCLEKDPGRRPPSASLVASALPGGDPLAAAIAAGETPSPDLVASAGQEGTLPRWQAWAWLAACLVALAALPFAIVPFILFEYARFDQSPDVLLVRAGEIVRRLGYTDQPADRAWWFRYDGDEAKQLDGMSRSEISTALRSGTSRPFRFCYRQSAGRMGSAGFFSGTTADDPPAAPGDVYAELDLGGRLLFFRATLSSGGLPVGPREVDWKDVSDAAQVGALETLAAVEPRWWPPVAVEARAARTGMHAGQAIRVEASSRGGRIVTFRLETPWSTGTAQPPALHPFLAVGRVVLWVTLIVLAPLARRNLRLGRGDRRGARRLSVILAAAVALSLWLRGHAPEGFLSDLRLAAIPFFVGLAAWVCYMGLEPSLRRAWPRLLIASSRLLDGGWRDPLVGRSLLAGVLVGLFLASDTTNTWAALLSGAASAGVVADSVPILLGPAPAYLSVVPWIAAIAISVTLLFLGLLLIARLLFRRELAAWLAFFVLLAGWFHAANVGQLGPWAALPGAIVGSAAVLWVVRRHGALALAVAVLVTVAPGWTPWTFDMSRWYAWRQWFVVALIVGLAVWGFRNVLGKQSAFPANVLDA